MFVDKSQDLDVMVPRRTLEEDQSGEEEETEDKPAGVPAAASPAAPSSTTAAAAAAVNVILNNVAPPGPPPSGKPIIVKDTNSSNATPKATTLSSSTTVKKVQLAPGGGSSTLSSSKTQSNILMGRIDAHTDVSNRTTFSGSDVPQYGVLTDHQAELEKVYFDITHMYNSHLLMRIAFQVLGNVNASWGVDVFRVRDLVFENRALTCITYRIFQVKLYSYSYLHRYNF